MVLFAFYYLIDLHYSQTDIVTHRSTGVLLPYRFTLFSNPDRQSSVFPLVLLPYRFTLFSNAYGLLIIRIIVLLPYRFTLFSNKRVGVNKILKFYYLIDLHYSQTARTSQFCDYCFTTLQIYTILKHNSAHVVYNLSFTTLQIYTILKLNR